MNKKKGARIKEKKEYTNISTQMLGKYKCPFPIRFSDSMPDIGLEQHGRPVVLKKKQTEV